MQLNPPRPSISWEAVSHINFLEEFNILHNTRQDIREKPWSQPAIRELMKLSQRLKRAHEEIERCHIAVRRLYTAIHDENDDFKKSLSRLRTGDPLIYGAVYEFVVHRQRVNDLLLARLKLLTESPDYSGDCSRGVRVGRVGSSDMGASHQEQSSRDDAWMAETPDGGDRGGERGVEDDDNDELGVDDTDEMVGQLVDYVSDLALLP